MVGNNRWLHFGLPVVALVSLITAGLADFVFYKQTVGWTLGGFVAWLLLLLLIRNRRAILAGPRWVWGCSLVLMTIGLCVSLVIEPGTIAVVLCLITLSSLAILAHGWSGRRLGWRWLWLLTESWLGTLIRPITDSRLARKWSHRTSGLRSRAFAAARLAWAVFGVLVPLVLSLVFLGLFSLANPIVADWMGRGVDEVSDFFFNLTEYITITRLLLWYAAGFVCWGLLRHRPRRTPRIVKLGKNLISRATTLEPKQAGEPAADPVQAAAAKKREQQDEPQESSTAPTPEQASPAKEPPSEDMLAWLARQYQNLIVRCLIAMNIVFAVQLVLDSRYLLLGETLPEGMTYAQYAHRGAYPLIVTAILAAGLVLAVFRPGGIAQRSKLAVWLVLIWIMQNILLVVSAVWRLGAYVEVYTLTRLRVAAAVWMLMVAGCLALLLWRIARSRDNAWLTGWAMGWGVAVLWLCSFVPFDPLIANYNAYNCKELGGHAGAIDLAYLEQLGPDALPAVTYLIENLPAQTAEAPSGFEPEPNNGRNPQHNRYEVDDYVPFDNGSLGMRVDAIRIRLSADLADQLDNWRGWTVRRAWLKQSAAD